MIDIMMTVTSYTIRFRLLLTLISCLSIVGGEKLSIIKVFRPATVMTGAYAGAITDRKPVVNSTRISLSTLLKIPLKGKIIGGEDVVYSQHPWQARVLFPNGRGLCGAAIIYEFWLISAAHCFEDGQYYFVVVGEHNLVKEDVGEQKFGVEVFKHEMFNRITADNDIALLKIIQNNSKAIQYSKFVHPACIPKPSAPFDEGTMCEITGWGKNQTAINRPTEILQRAKVPLITQQTCSALDLDPKRVITKRMFCAGLPEGGVDSCKGDSGGPLICINKGCPTIYGISSWGRGCGQPNKPTVYVRVSEFEQWIHATIKLNSYIED